MQNPTTAQDYIDALNESNFTYRSFDFVETEVHDVNRFFWGSSGPITVYMDVLFHGENDYHDRKGRGLPLIVGSINRSSGGENGLDTVSTNRCFIKLLENACSFVEDCKANEDLIAQAVVQKMVVKYNARKAEAEEAQRKIDEDTKFTESAAKDVISAMRQLAKEGKQVKVTMRRRGSDKLESFYALHKGSTVRFAKSLNYFDTSRLSVNKLVARFVKHMAEVSKIEVEG